MLGYVVALLVGVVIAAAFVYGIVRAFRRLARVEALALCWWAAVALLAFVGISTRQHAVIGLAGVLMLGLGLFLALDMGGIADRLGRRRIGFGPVWTQYSPAYWRLSGLFLAVIGAFWTLALGAPT
jgi:hypothetical protein